MLPKSYGQFNNISSKYKLIVLDLGLRRKFSWPFIVADVTKTIIGADFLVNFGLLVDLRTKKTT